jgi:hypothetical protein
MESMKNSLQLIEASMAVRRQDYPEAPPPVTPADESISREPEQLARIACRKHDGADQVAGKKIDKTQLINKLNFINFQDGTVLINFKHAKYDKTIHIKATPQPCLGDHVDCLWAEGIDVGQLLKFYHFSDLLITNGQKLVRVEPELIQIDEAGISFMLPETCYEISSRRARRFACKGISVQFIQNSSIFFGAMLDFNGFSFRVKLSAVPPQTFEWVNPEYPVNVILSDGPMTLYCGECRIIRHTQGYQARNYILQPIKQAIQRFKKKEYRSERYELSPSPNIVCRHPFTQSRLDLKVVNLSGSGFAVEEDETTTTLLPGLILPEVQLSFANSYQLKCSAQVIYRKTITETNGSKWNKCGLALLDMAAQDHLELTALLHQTKDRNSYISNTVDLDALWDFFFETGFIYPGKYAAIQKNKRQIKATYAKIYTQHPQIARHFIYQEKGTILGHMSMIRFFERAWLIHHHAARKSALNKAGLIVLDQIGRMINDSHRLHSLHMDYMLCYYRPENKFPSRVFGGAARSINDLRGCSLDSFAYLHYNPTFRSPLQLPKDWEIIDARREDLQELEDFYTYASGGLMMKALDLTPDKIDCNDLSKEFRLLGLNRRRRLLALKKKGVLKAVVLANISDIGLNLSDITNCVKAFFLEAEGFAPEILDAAISKVAEITSKDDFPLLIFPSAFADAQAMPYEKIYNLWICSLQYSDEYFKFIRRLLRLS